MVTENQCPVCGYGMEEEPTSYTICPSCGTEFGLHDGNASILALRRNWLQSGPKWWSSTDPQPENWNPVEQLAAYLRGARITNPRLQMQNIYLGTPVMAGHPFIVKQPNSESKMTTVELCDVELTA